MGDVNARGLSRPKTISYQSESERLADEPVVVEGTFETAGYPVPCAFYTLNDTNGAAVLRHLRYFGSRPVLKPLTL